MTKHRYAVGPKKFFSMDTEYFIFAPSGITLFCLHSEMEGHWSRVNLVKREVFSHPYIYSMLKRQITPKKSFKNVNFSVT